MTSPNFVVRFIDGIFSLYYVLIVLRIFMSWIPNIDWEKEPTRTVRIIVDAYLDLFRRFIPPINGLDFSPIVALIILPFIQSFFVRIAMLLTGM